MRITAIFIAGVVAFYAIMMLAVDLILAMKG
jgi:hypothetical protein